LIKLYISELANKLSLVVDDLEEVGQRFNSIDKKIKALCDNRRQAARQASVQTFKPLQYNHAQDINEVFINAYYTTE